MATVHELIAASDAAERAFESGDYADHDTAERGFLDAYNAAVQARPATLTECAAWLRWALKEEGAIQGGHLEMPGTIAHITAQLETLAGAAA